MNKPENTGDATKTPFVYFVSGTPVYPANTVYACAEEALKQGNLPIRQFLKEHAKQGSIGGISTILTDGWWFHFLLSYLDHYHSNFSEPQSLEDSAVQILRIMANAAPADAWNNLVKHIISDIDNLSGWSKCWIREFAGKRNVFKGEDGYYYFNDLDGTLVQIIGEKTEPETRLDFITDQILRSYGCLRQIFNVFSAFAIAYEFERSPEMFPRSMKVVLDEPKFPGTSHRWQLMQYERTRSIRWRPHSNYCDPDWLAGDLLARLTDTLDRNLWQERVEKQKDIPNRLDEDCPWELDYVLDSGLTIGQQDEIYFQFEGRTFRWINGTPESKAIVSVGVKNLTSHHEEDEAINRLLSALVWEHRRPIVKGSGVGGAKRSLPLTWGPRMSIGVRVDPAYLFQGTGVSSPERWLALALFKEGINSGSIFYRFLNFWKILEVAIKDKTSRWNWINSQAPTMGQYQGRLTQIMALSATIAEYLDYSGRCAIAHVFRRPFVNPDDHEDYVRISQDVPIAEHLARKAVTEFFPEQVPATP